jgi:hypothetical protein
MSSTLAPLEGRMVDIVALAGKALDNHWLKKNSTYASIACLSGLYVSRTILFACAFAVDFFLLSLQAF